MTTFENDIRREKSCKPRKSRFDTATTIVLFTATIFCILALAWTQKSAAATTQARRPTIDHCKQHIMPISVCYQLRSATHEAGVPRSWAWSPALAHVLQHESGFDWCAVNPSHHDCVYRGPNHSCGIAQRLPCVERVFRSRRAQSVNLLRYVYTRYGTPEQAWAHWQVHRTY